jgi:hypothetical protein
MPRNLALVALLLCFIGAGGAWIGGAFNSQPKPDHLLIWGESKWGEAVWG